MNRQFSVVLRFAIALRERLVNDLAVERHLWVCLGKLRRKNIFMPVMMDDYRVLHRSSSKFFQKPECYLEQTQFLTENLFQQISSFLAEASPYNLHQET